MHKGLAHIVASFEEIHEAFKGLVDQDIIMNTPMNQIIRVNNRRLRNNTIKVGRPTKISAPDLLNSRDVCEVKLIDLATLESMRETYKE